MYTLSSDNNTVRILGLYFFNEYCNPTYHALEQTYAEYWVRSFRKHGFILLQKGIMNFNSSGICKRGRKFLLALNLVLIQIGSEKAILFRNKTLSEKKKKGGTFSLLQTK